MVDRIMWHQTMAPDEDLGRVDEDGSVYESRFGPDKYIGRVNLENGRVYRSLVGPDDYIGRIDLENGDVYLARVGPDEYVGRVESDGRMFLHRPLAADPYLGKIEPMSSLANAGAGFLLLILPRFREENKQV